MTSRPSTAAPILAAILLLLLPLGAYVAGYFWLSERIDLFGKPPSDMPTGIIRTYPHRWQESAFHPAAVVEGRLRGIPVSAGVPPDSYDVLIDLITTTIVPESSGTSAMPIDPNQPPDAPP